MAAASDALPSSCPSPRRPLCRAPLFYSFEGGPRWALAIRRYAALKGIARERDAEVALGRLRGLGLRWYVVTDPGAPLWDPARCEGSARLRGVALYEIAR
jgi:hypothetical protein